jgi:hypothetical protein
LIVLCYDPLPQDTPRVIKSLSKSDFQQLEVTHRNINEHKHKWRKNMSGCGLCAKWIISLPWCQGLALWILATLQHPDEMLDVKLLENMEALWLSWRLFHCYQNKGETRACTWIYHYVKKSRTWCCAARYTGL